MFTPCIHHLISFFFSSLDFYSLIFYRRCIHTLFCVFRYGWVYTPLNTSFALPQGVYTCLVEPFCFCGSRRGLFSATESLLKPPYHGCLIYSIKILADIQVLASRTRIHPPHFRLIVLLRNLYDAHEYRLSMIYERICKFSPFL